MDAVGDPLCDSTYHIIQTKPEALDAMAMPIRLVPEPRNATGIFPSGSAIRVRPRFFIVREATVGQPGVVQCRRNILLTDTNKTSDHRERTGSYGPGDTEVHSERDQDPGT